VTERRQARSGSVLFLLAGAMFFVAAMVGGKPAFYGVSAAFVGVAAAFRFRGRNRCG
jgi:hypothetical protein